LERCLEKTVLKDGDTLDIDFYELSDGRFLGVTVFEITSFPDISAYSGDSEANCGRISEEFTRVMTELHKLSGANICMEFIWFAEQVQNQVFSSQIRIFGILRKIGTVREEVCKGLEVVQSNISTFLVSMQFDVRQCGMNDETLSSLIESVDGNCFYGIVKSEKCAANPSSLYPYYYADIIPGENHVNFNSLIATLSQCRNCCTSFQLFPTQLTGDEMLLISEMSSQLSRIVNGTMIDRQLYRDPLAAQPLKVYAYYNERRNSPFFLYNIVAIGERNCCAGLAAKLVSLLQSGREKVSTADLVCIDLSAEKINLKKQFPYYVWNVNHRLLFHYRNARLQSAFPIAKRLLRLPYLMSVEEAAAFYRLPLHEKTMPALKGGQTAYSQEQFENAVIAEDNVRFGELLLNSGTKITIGCPPRALTKHALIVGMPGSGKTTFSIDLLLQFSQRNIPFLAIEPTKTEYRAMIDAIPYLQIFTPGNNSVLPYIVNPFIPPKGIRIEQYIPSLASAFKAAFSMPSPLDVIFLKAMRTCYIQYGWKDYSTREDPDVKPFGLYEFILVFKKLMGVTNYSKEVRGNIESAGLLRLTNLIEQNSNIYDTVNTIPIEDLLTTPTILELNAIDNAEQKSLVMALLLIGVCLYTKHNHTGDGELKNVILIDEAHVLLQGGSISSTDNAPDAQGTTVKALQDMIAEIRSYGTSIIIADQSPTKVSREVVANTDIKIAFRLVQAAEKALIADSTNMDNVSQDNLSRLRPGEAYVYYSLLDSPQLIRTLDIREQAGIRLSVSNTEIAGRCKYWEGHRKLLRPYVECEYCQYCQDSCDFQLRSDAEFIANLAFQKYRDSIKSVEAFKKCIYYLPRLMSQEIEQFSGAEQVRLTMCARIRLIRKIMLDLPVGLSEEEKKLVITKFPTQDQTKEELQNV